MISQSFHQLLLVTLLCLLLLASTTISQQIPSECHSDLDCQDSNLFCKGHIGAEIPGTCQLKPDGFCRDSEDCEDVSMACVHEPAMEHGTCQVMGGEAPPPPPTDEEDPSSGETPVPVDATTATNTESPLLEIEEIPIPQLTDEEYDMRPWVPETDEDTTCGVDSDEFHKHVEALKMAEKRPDDAQDDDDDITAAEEDKIPSCGQSTCDIPSVRDSYSQRINKKFKLEFIYFDCTTPDWKPQAVDGIAEATYDLNERYRSIGIQFFSTLRIVKCPASWGNSLEISHDNFLQLIRSTFAKGESQITRGNFQILVGVNNNRYNGWAYFPTSRATSGLAFMNYKVMRKGVTTLSHEIGHAFLLHHTFAGVSGVSTSSGDDACPSCFDSGNSDIKGDFCSDTPSIPKTFECVSTLDASKYDKDLCNSRRTQWFNNPYENIMSYGVCRDEFSPQQMRRVRCAAEREMDWLKNYNESPLRKCVDYSSGCASFKSRGYCAQDSGYTSFMASRCMRTCGYCHDAEESDASSSTTRGVITPKKGSCENVKGGMNCSTWKNAGYCLNSSKYNSFMRENCAQTCGFCSDDDDLMAADEAFFWSDDDDEEESF